MCPISVPTYYIGGALDNKLEAQGPLIGHLITNSEQFSQLKRQPE